jgi:UDP-glucose 4-epimerase
LLNKEQDDSYQVFNLGTGNGYTVLDVLNMFESVTNVKLNYRITERRAGDVPVLYAATNLAEEKLKWKAELNLKEMINSSWKWEQSLRA